MGKDTGSGNETAGMVKKGTMFMVAGFALLIGFLAGVGFAVYRMPATGMVTEGREQPRHDLARLEQQVKETPDDPEAWSHLGHAYFDADEYDKAIAAYTRSLELAPDNPDILTDLGVMYRRSGRPDKAIAAFDQAIRVNPAHVQPRFNKGVVLFFDKHDHQGAFAAWQELLEIDPQFKAPDGQPLAVLLEQLRKEVAKEGVRN